MLKAIGSRKDLKQQLYYEFVADLLESKSVQDLKQYRHHIKTTRFQHSLNVSYYNYLICKFFHWDAVSAAVPDCCTICIFMKQPTMMQPKPMNPTVPIIHKWHCTMQCSCSR